MSISKHDGVEHQDLPVLWQGLVDAPVGRVHITDEEITVHMPRQAGGVGCAWGVPEALAKLAAEGKLYAINIGFAADHARATQLLFAPKVLGELAEKIMARLREAAEHREATTAEMIASVLRSELKESPFELLVRITAEEQGISQFAAATKLTVMSEQIKAHDDAQRFAAIARARMLAGEKA